MASTKAAARDVPSDDDDVFGDDDIFDASKIVAQEPQAPQRQQDSASTNANTALGLDEIKVVRQRRPNPKLDENRLLSDAGIPKLRRIAKDRMKFKGKGHEYGDIARMLNMYQLWLDDLYPKAKFADGLAMIEKLGHTKRIQYMRKQWIDEGKPKHTTEVDFEADEPHSPKETVEGATDPMEGLSLGDSTSRTPPHLRTLVPVAFDEDPDEDELDALLAEGAADIPMPTTTMRPKPRAANAEEDMFADEMELIGDMDHMW
ncbi:Swi3-domain-containing protein [Amniculicola lignicola CBS 123094]|uniref:Chromosome segregation in meiosis protein n=1 Tax=Amniculicola lignicola CBS 123094 TaxID=1392246 RepID=A0A6A5WE00_9PLEO|nr:Swi3-domain-containing protein [Amniculicola lignicola CBS 123094]